MLHPENPLGVSSPTHIIRYTKYMPGISSETTIKYQSAMTLIITMTKEKIFTSYGIVLVLIYIIVIIDSIVIVTLRNIIMIIIVGWM